MYLKEEHCVFFSLCPSRARTNSPKGVREKSLPRRRSLSRRVLFFLPLTTLRRTAQPLIRVCCSVRITLLLSHDLFLLVLSNIVLFSLFMSAELFFLSFYLVFIEVHARTQSLSATSSLSPMCVYHREREREDTQRERLRIRRHILSKSSNRERRTCSKSSKRKRLSYSKSSKRER